MDPLASKYAEISVYNFSFNDPVNFNDPNGDDAGGGDMKFVNGRLANPRTVWGYRETDSQIGFLSRQQFDMSNQGYDVAGVTSQSQMISDIYQHASLNHALLSSGLIGVNYIKDSNGNLINPMPWSAGPISVQSSVPQSTGWSLMTGAEGKMTVGPQGGLNLANVFKLKLNIAAMELLKTEWNNKTGFSRGRVHHKNYHVTQGAEIAFHSGIGWEHSFDLIDGIQMNQQHEIKVNIWQLVGVFKFDGDWNNTDVFLGLEAGLEATFGLSVAGKAYLGANYKVR